MSMCISNLQIQNMANLRGRLRDGHTNALLIKAQILHPYLGLLQFMRTLNHIDCQSLLQLDAADKTYAAPLQVLHTQTHRRWKRACNKSGSICLPILPLMVLSSMRPTISASCCAFSCSSLMSILLSCSSVTGSFFSFLFSIFVFFSV